MNITKNAFVSLSYELRTEGTAEGPLVERTSADRPLRFVFGTGLMLPCFEKNIEGLAEGDSFSFVLKSNEAYGERNEEAVVEIPKDVFVVDGQLREEFLQVGRTVPMVGEGGQRLDGRVLEVTDSIVRMDFNHPLAGEELYFVGKILEVREATEDELHPKHGCGGCHGGCGSEGGCGGGCGEGGCGCGEGDGCDCGK